MGHGNDDMGWRTLMAFAGIAVATLVAYRFWPLWVEICPGDESGEIASCVRTWIGALSGWAAAVGALAAAVLTIPHLRRQAIEATRQADESKRQADYLLGESGPTIDVVEHIRDVGELVVRLANWNRRSIFIKTIRFSTLGVTLQILRAEVDDVDQNYVYAGEFTPPVPVEGWIDRSKQPHGAKIRIVGIHPPTGEVITEWDDETEVLIGIQMIGATEPVQTLRSKIVTH